MTNLQNKRTGRPVAIRAAHLFDGSGAAMVADPLVVLDGERIRSVQSGPAAVVPPDAELVELPGATLLPGLIDTHVHLSFDASMTPVDTLATLDDDAALEAMAGAAAAHLRAGVTTVRDLGDRDYLALRLRTAGGRMLPTIVASGPPITSVGGHCHFLGGAVSGVKGVRAAVRDHVDRGVDVIKVMASGGEMTPGSDVHHSQFSPAELRTVVDEAHHYGLPVTAHAHCVEAISDAINAGVDGLEHCAFRVPGGVEARDDLIASIVKRQIAVGATLGSIPIPAGIVPPPGVRELLRLLPQIFAAIGRLQAEGAVVVAGTDAGIAPVKPHGVLPFGLIELAALGASPVEALLAGTSIAAGVCGLGDRKGRIAPGFDADLLAVDGDPTIDLTVLHRPVSVFACGRPVVPNRVTAGGHS